MKIIGREIGHGGGSDQRESVGRSSSPGDNPSLLTLILNESQFVLGVTFFKSSAAFLT
jgi:hypothetical protein